MARAYLTQVRVTDFGPYLTKIILPLDGKVKDGAIGPDTFSVYVRRLDHFGKQLNDMADELLGNSDHKDE